MALERRLDDDMDWTSVAERLGIGFAVGLFLLISGAAMMRWLLTWFTSQLASGQSSITDIVKSQQTVITNHIDHATRAEEKMSAAVDKLADAVDRQSEVMKTLCENQKRK